MSSEPQIEVGKAVEIFLLLLKKCPRAIDEQLILKWFSGIVLKSQAQVARVFGVSPNTVKTSWKASGMPGGPDGYDLAQIAIWLWRRDVSNAESWSVLDEYTKRKRDAETRKAEFDAMITEQRAQRASGSYIATAIAISGVRGMAATLRDQLADIPRRMEIRFPPKHAKESVADLETMIRNALVAFTERSTSDIRAAAEQGSSSDV